ncbi:MAG TPA: endonuclease/exonuclease/phosphatase family protein, partial [Allocoleopsis sp.]
MVKWILKLNIWVIIFTLIAYAAPFIKPSEVSFLMLVGVAYPWLLVLNLIFIGIWAVSRYRYWWYSTICILLGVGNFISVFGVNYFKSKSNNSSSLKIITLNVLGFDLPAYKRNKIEGYKQLNAFFEKENADVICLQEVTGTPEQFKKQIENFPFCPVNYPYFFRIKDNGMAFLSKYPIQSGDILPINKNGSNGCTYADILINNKTIRFYNIQLQSNEVSDIADNLANKGELDDKNSWFSFLKMLKRFRKCAIKREKES